MSRTDAEVSRLLAGAARTVRTVRYCWLVTTTEDGGVGMRPMGRLLHDPDKDEWPDEDEWTIRFVTDGRSRKASDIRRAGRVALVFQHAPEDAYVALIGHAALRSEAAEIRRRWKAGYDAYFPTDQDRANAIFVEVGVECMELWIRGVTPEPFGMRATRLERDDTGTWRLIADGRKAAA